MTQEDLAAKCELHRSYICDVERGARNITLFSLLKIAKGLQASPVELLADIELENAAVQPFDAPISVIQTATPSKRLTVAAAQA